MLSENLVISNDDEWKLIIILTVLPNTSDNYRIIASESIQKRNTSLWAHVRLEALLFFFFF